MSDKMIDIQRTEQGYKIKITSPQTQQSVTLETFSDQETRQLLEEAKDAISIIEKDFRTQQLKKIMGDLSD